MADTRKPKVIDMKPIRDIKDIENLKTDEKLIEFCLNGKVNYYRFLCFHPRNTNYVILLNHCEEPERFYVKSIIDRFYTDYTTRDIITYRRNYALKNSKSTNRYYLNLIRRVRNETDSRRSRKRILRKI